MKRTITQLVLMGGVAGFLFWRGHTIAAMILSGLAVLMLLLAVFAPGVLATLHEAVDRLAAWVSAGIGLALLTIIYFTIFTAGALLLRIRNVDPMNRRFPLRGESNWIDRVGYGDAAIYSKQYTRPHARGSKGAT